MHQKIRPDERKLIIVAISAKTMLYRKTISGGKANRYDEKVSETRLKG